MADYENIVNEDGTVTRRDFTPEEIAARAVWARKALVPSSVSARQARLLLLSQGLLPTVEQMMAQQDDATQINWKYAETFNREDPLLLQLAAALSLSDEQLDGFFIAAAEL